MILCPEKKKCLLEMKDTTPSFVYFESEIKNGVEKFKQYTAPNGLQVRYAMKANANL